MKLLRVLCTAPLLLGLMTWQLLGHHSVAVFDQTKATTIQGVITKLEWMNPHTLITFETKDANGLPTSWLVEIAASGALVRDGIRREVFELAKSCSMEIWPARDGSKIAIGRRLTFAEGKSFDVRDKFWDRFPLSAPAK